MKHIITSTQNNSLPAISITLADAISAIGQLHQLILEQNDTKQSLPNEMKCLKD